MMQSTYWLKNTQESRTIRLFTYFSLRKLHFPYGFITFKCVLFPDGRKGSSAGKLYALTLKLLAKKKS